MLPSGSEIGVATIRVARTFVDPGKSIKQLAMLLCEEIKKRQTTGRAEEDSEEPY